MTTPTSDFIKVSSWDCGYKPLANVHMTIAKSPLEAFKRVEGAICGRDALQLVLTSLIHIEVCTAHNIVEKRLDEYSQTELLRNTYAHLKSRPIDPTRVYLVEAQPPKVNNATNVTTGPLSNQLGMYFISHGCAVEFIDPHRKSAISLGPGLDLATFKRQYIDAYAARKAHAIANLYHFLKVSGQEHIIAHIRKSMIKDVADAFMQALAYVFTPRAA